MKKVDIHDLLNKISLLFKNKIFITITIILILIPWILLSLQDTTINNIKENKYSLSNNKVSYTNVPTALNNFYSRLKFPDTYVYSTNKFLCTGTNITCISEDYTNIGLINKDEYNKIQGYLKGSKSYWTMSKESTSVFKITSNGIELENSSNSVALRPSIYLQGDLRISGSGIPNDPYIIKEKNTPDTQILALYVNGVKTDTLSTTKYYELTSYVCNKPSVTLLWNKNNRELTAQGIVSAPLQCSLYFEIYTPTPDASGANAPMLASNMIPITWNGTMWVKANINNDWYNYSEKRWANAVVVTEATRNTYLNAAAGTVITESDVLAYYVWIPRYAYKITSGYHSGTAGAIDVKFLVGTTLAAADGSNIYTDNLTNAHHSFHPVFNFGGTHVKGIWVAKFELTGTITTGCTTETCATAPITSKPYITIPAPKSIDGQSVRSYYYASRSMERLGNEYGFVSSEVDTHMIKNTEWGMVAYLTESQYGKGDELWENNSLGGYTGCTSSLLHDNQSLDCPHIYSSINGQNASTTGNIYGIYDMSGGMNEYVMGNCYNTTGSSGLTLASILNKYIDKYASTYTASTIYGDAVYETTSNVEGMSNNAWYGDYTWPITTTYPWIVRGGKSNNLNAYNNGIFNYGVSDGTASAGISSRFVLIVGSDL